MLNVEQFRLYVVRPVLNYLELGGAAAEQLLVGTALTESKLTYLKQIGLGPALGVFQMEPATHNDIWNNFLKYKPELAEKVGNLLTPGDKVQQLVGNLPYAAAMCRIHYLRVPKALPGVGDIKGFSFYWKNYYNTQLGAGTPEDFVKAAGQYLD